MTRKDYIVIATGIREGINLASVKVDDEAFNAELARSQRVIIDKIADYLAAENPRFDRGRFREACGVSS